MFHIIVNTNETYHIEFFYKNIRHFKNKNKKAKEKKPTTVPRAISNGTFELAFGMSI